MSGDDQVVFASFVPSILPGRKEHFQAFAPPVVLAPPSVRVERSVAGHTPSMSRRTHADITQPIVSKPIVRRPIFTETMPAPAVVTYSPLPNLIVHAWRDPNVGVATGRGDPTAEANRPVAVDRGVQTSAAALDVTQRMPAEPAQSMQSTRPDPLGQQVVPQLSSHATSDANRRTDERRDRVLIVSLIGVIVLLLVSLAFAVGLAVGEHRDVTRLMKTRSTPAAAAAAGAHRIER